MKIKQALAQLVLRENLSEEDMHSVMMDVMTGEVSPAQIGALLVALRMKGETVEEITAAVRVMRELATPVNVNVEYLVDTCGTGGDGANLFNVSTASAFVVAAAGGSVAKHGNRSISSSTGSADVLEEAGVNLSMPPEMVARAVESIGVGFMFAPAHHSAMKYAIGPRKELGLRTVFNMLGPLTNPAGVKRQVIGVFNKALCRPVAEVLGRLGSEHVIVVHAADGLDEFSIAATNYVAELKEGVVTEYEIEPANLGIMADNLEGLDVVSSSQSLQLIRAAFSAEDTVLAKKATAIIALNAGAAIYVSGVAKTLQAGVEMAEDALSSGAAMEKLKQLAEFSRCI